MSIFKKLKKLILGIAAVSMSAALLMPGAIARAEDNDNSGLGYIDMDRDASLSVYYYFNTYGDIPEYGKMAGVKAKVYKIADISRTGEFTVLSPYDTLGLQITDMRSIADQEKWDGIITELKRYVVANNTQPTLEAVSDQEGYAKFGVVDKGLYFGVSDPIVIDGIKYQYWDFLSVVPGPSQLDETGSTLWDGSWRNASYDVIAIPKREAVRLEGDPEIFNVYKQWIDGAGDNRPSSISVNIFCDGALLESVELSSANNWQYSWQYEKGHNFSVQEVMNTDDYTSAISRNEDTFIIVNTRKPEQPEAPKTPETPSEPDVPELVDKPKTFDTPERVDVPFNPVVETPEETPGVLGAIRQFVGELPAVLGARRLPQTGQLWWPIPVLAIIGLLLVIFGFRSERRRKDK